MTYTPVLAADGADLAAALTTIRAIGDDAALAAAVDDAFPGSTLAIGMDEPRGLAMRQHGLLRPLGVTELSDGTLRYLLLIAALLSPRPPELMILNEPEASLHPSLLDALARLLQKAARSCQIILVSHSERLVEALCEEDGVQRILLEKEFGETKVSDAIGPRWVWPSR
jgi:predicted ATPase